MFDDLTFALRYGPIVRISYALLLLEIPVPVTQDTVHELKRTGWWPEIEDRFAPYVVAGPICARIQEIPVFDGIFREFRFGASLVLSR
jgi:hypothetical protein